MSRKATKNVDYDFIEIDSARINETCEAFFKWKDLNTYISNLSHRGLNMPDAISEPMGCYALHFKWNRGTVGDATDRANRKIEFKASSNFDSDLTSFGPESTFDDLVFLRFDLPNNRLFIYDLGINSQQLGSFKVNKEETVEDQRKAKRRPRLRLIQEYIIPNKIAPTLVFDIRLMKTKSGISFENAEKGEIN